MDDKDRHKEKLQDICRLCGSDGITLPNKRHQAKSTWSAVIKRALDIDVSLDIDDIHPPSVCGLCSKKLSRWREKQRKRQTASISIVVPDFEPHAPDCKYCVSHEEEDGGILDAVMNAQDVLQGKMVFNQREGKVIIVELDDEGMSEKCCIINCDGSWRVRHYGKVIDPGIDILKDFPPNLSPSQILEFLEAIMKSHVCPGNEDFGDISPEDVMNRPVYHHPSKYDSLNVSLRHNSCPILKGDVGRCGTCTIYRTDLGILRKRLKKEKETASTSSFKPHAHLSKTEMRNRLEKMSKERKAMGENLVRLRKSLHKMIRKEGEIIDKKVSKSFKDIFQAHNADFPEGSPAKLLWEEQQKFFTKPPRQMRWHPSILRLCIAIHSKSPAAYDLLRSSGYLHLPHKNTLFNYTHCFDINPGYSSDFLSKIAKDINIESLPPHQKNVSVVFDEMKVKSGLVYTSRGKLVGFTDLGDINNELLKYRKEAEDNTTQNIATHALTIMIRGIFHNLHTPVGFFPCDAMTADQLYHIIWEGVERLHFAGFHVRAFVSDGATTNRKFYKLCSSEHFTINPFNPDHKIYFISDVPHLIKTTRNNFENSGSHNNTRNMMLRGAPISWRHILDVNAWDTGHINPDGTAQGLRMLNKITAEHLNLTPSSRMRVSLAAQVLSTSMASALKMQQQQSSKPLETSSTITFIEYFNQFFDCMNVSNISQHIKSRNPALAPYKSVDDWRLLWLEEDFLGLLDEWESEGMLVPGLKAADRQKLCLSKATLDGLRLTVRSFVQLAKELLLEDGVEFVLSEKFSQDPLEEYFSRQRGVGGRFDNPDVHQFGSNILPLHVAGSSIAVSAKANVKSQKRKTAVDSTPLQSRKRKR
ncbi:uncharacterized protein [Diadema antillarum]|uniref:uncharacterized protein n=1 Tax=Diadema antillarum TaxID=105358 RepID=UPI003A86EAA8